MREQGRLAGEESGRVVHFRDFDFSSCGLGRILREEEHDRIYAVKSFWLLCPEGELSWGGRRGSTWPWMAVVWVRMVRFCEYLKALLTRFVLRCALWEKARVRGLRDWKNGVAFYWNVNQRMGGEEVVTTWSCFLHLLHLRCLYICVHAAGSPSLNPGK